MATAGRVAVAGSGATAGSADEIGATAGYGATSIDAIAAEAGVAVPTVYTAFGATREILSAICERWLVLILDGAVDENPETQALLRAKLAGRDQVMDAMIASLADPRRVPLPEAQAVFRALAASRCITRSSTTRVVPGEVRGRWVSDVAERHLLDRPGDVDDGPRPERPSQVVVAARDPEQRDFWPQQAGWRGARTRSLASPVLPNAETLL